MKIILLIVAVMLAGCAGKLPAKNCEFKMEIAGDKFFECEKP